jgi:hypothetical protein
MNVDLRSMNVDERSMSVDERNMSHKGTLLKLDSNRVGTVKNYTELGCCD